MATAVPGTSAFQVLHDSAPNAKPKAKPMDVVRAESEPEDEVDQLDSDSDAVVESASKAGGAAADSEKLLREAGQTNVPLDKLQAIVTAEGVTGSLLFSKEALFVLGAATEEFVKRLTKGAQLQAAAERRSSLLYTDISNATLQYQEFMFLQETIPTPIPLKDALELRAAKLAEDEDPSATPASKTPSYPLPRTHRREAPTGSSSAQPRPNLGTPSAPPVLNQQMSYEAWEAHKRKFGSNGTSASVVHHPPSTASTSQTILDARPWTSWSVPQTGARAAPSASVSTTVAGQSEGAPEPPQQDTGLNPNALPAGGSNGPSSVAATTPPHSSRDSSVRADLAPSINGQSAAPSGANTPADPDVRMGSPPPTDKPDSPNAGS